MLAVWILLGILILAFLLGRLPVSVTGEYKADGPEVVARLGPIKIQLYPGKKTEKETTHKEEPPKEKAPTENKRTNGGKIGPFRELLGLILQAQADIRNKLRIRELTLYLTVGGKGDDPASAGILTGSAWAALGGLIPLLESGFRIEDRDIQVSVDFLTEETVLYAKATAAISLGAGIRLVGYYGLQGLKWYRKQKQKQKGGNEYGTSNQ